MEGWQIVHAVLKKYYEITRKLVDQEAVIRAQKRSINNMYAKIKGQRVEIRRLSAEPIPVKTYIATEHAVTCDCGAVTLHPPHLISVVCPSCKVQLVRKPLFVSEKFPGKDWGIKPNFTDMAQENPHLYCQCDLCRESRK